MRNAALVLLAFSVVTPTRMTCASEAETSARALTDGTWSSRAPAWSPDGKRIAFEQERGGRWIVQVVSIESGDIQAVGTAQADERFPAWSPDGRRLITACRQHNDVDLCVRNLDTGTIETVVPVSGDVLWPDWSADGARIAVGRQQAAALDVIILAYRPDAPIETIATLPDARWPRWSADGNRLAFFSRRADPEADDEVYVLDRRSGASSRVTHRDGHDFCPDWSPSGEHLVLVSVEPDGSRSLRIVDLGGREIDRFATGLHRVTEPAWSPDGRSIAYAAILADGQNYRLFVDQLEHASP